MLTSEWPPTYTVRRHSRARHVKLTYTQHGLTVTIPMRFSVKHIPSIIEENKDWIIKQNQQQITKPPLERPQQITFTAFQQHWTVHYFQNEKRPRVKTIVPNGLIISGDIADLTVCLAKLNAWVRLQAHALLSDYLHALSRQIGLPFSDVSVRSQSTLWGSCSHDKSIRLNYKLIFLPPELMRHIMIHELCHTRHMNHSDRFWDLVASFDEYWLEHKKAIKKADQYIPAWLK